MSRPALQVPNPYARGAYVRVRPTSPPNCAAPGEDAHSSGPQNPRPALSGMAWAGTRPRPGAAALTQRRPAGLQLDEGD
jgi:hypothetical protein